MLSNFKPSKRVIIEAVLLLIIAACIVAFAVIYSRNHRSGRGQTEFVEPEQAKLLYDIEYEQYEMVEDEVGNNQTLSHILGNNGISAALIDKTATVSKPVFDVRQLRSGKGYVMFFERDTTAVDSLATRHLRHLIYQKSVADYVVFSFPGGDSVVVREGHKDVEVRRRKVTADIESSLWNCIVDHQLPVALSCDLEDIFGWSVDFFSLQKGDEFTAVFEERFIDSVRIGTGRVWGAKFKHYDKEYYAIPFDQNGKIEYWDEKGNSLRKQLLKAPLKYSRITSRFSNARLHPILKVYRPHHGVDYGAPAGTPVMAIADGTVTKCGWDGSGGGNMIKLKHANNLQSSYMHLRGFASGVRAGAHVSQGQTIGYVGSTGRSTGPHLDFRLYKGGTAIDPLKAPSEPVEPLKAASMPAFELIRERVVAELNGEVADSVRITLRDLEPDKFETAEPDTTASADTTAKAQPAKRTK